MGMGTERPSRDDVPAQGVLEPSSLFSCEFPPWIGIWLNPRWSCDGLGIEKSSAGMPQQVGVARKRAAALKIYLY
jgi:hypothetical protein